MDIRHFLLAVVLFLCEAVAIFHVRPSATSTLTMAELRATSAYKHEQMYSCYLGCLQEPCCLAVELAAECEMSYFPTEAMDLVKEVSMRVYKD